MLFLTRHALDQMARRSITREEILEALADCATMYPSAQDDSRTVILGMTSTRRPLKVVVAEDDHECVITVADRSNDE